MIGTTSAGLPKFGYEYTPGTWNITILAFGRQTTQIVNGKLVWGVDLISTRPNAGFKANDWVVKVAQAFIDGHLDGHPSGHPNTIGFDIAIGTSNANHEPPNAPNGGNGTGWVCDNQTNRVDSRYTTAGQQWAMNVINKITAPSAIRIRSAVDWESWDDNYPDGWIACGLGAVKCIEQYDTKTDVMNINFGNNAHTTDPSQWTPQQVHTISFGNPRAFVAPQIYCNGQINPWVSLNDVDRISFLGITSDNASSNLCGTTTLSWSDAWNGLNNALVQAGRTDKLWNTATIPRRQYP